MNKKELTELPTLVSPLERGETRVEWVDAGMGQNGDFDPKDPKDMHLLNFNVYWKQHLLVSVKSQTSAEQPKEILEKLQVKIMDRFSETVNELGLSAAESPSFKEAVDELSWIGPEWTFEW